MLEAEAILRGPPSVSRTSFRQIRRRPVYGRLPDARQIPTAGSVITDDLKRVRSAKKREDRTDAARVSRIFALPGRNGFPSGTGLGFAPHTPHFEKNAFEANVYGARLRIGRSGVARRRHGPVRS